MTDAQAAQVVALMARRLFLEGEYGAVVELEAFSSLQLSAARRALTGAYHAVLDETRSRRRNGV